MKICYVPKDFTPEHLVIIAQANTLIEEHSGLQLTLRQLYYLFVSRNLIRNRQSEYSRLGGIISDARLAGMIDWEAIEDRIRFLQGVPFVDSVAHALHKAKDNYALDLWWNQDYRPEVWVEKDAASGIVGAICNKLRVNFFVTRGYNSQSEQWRAGQRLRDYVLKGQTPIVFHIGDHDPSGLHMTEDNRDRLAMFAGVPVQVVRIALNIDQVHKYSMPPNPVKLTDSRSPAYQAVYGDTSWELDAFPPRSLQALIEGNIMRLRDEKKWSDALAEEVEDIQTLENLAEGVNGG